MRVVLDYASSSPTNTNTLLDTGLIKIIMLSVKTSVHRVVYLAMHPQWRSDDAFTVRIIQSC